MHADAAEFIKEAGNGSYDVIVVDSSDPVGPAETLFTSSFYAQLKRALAPGGVVCCQGECVWLHVPLIAELLEVGLGGPLAFATGLCRLG